MQYVGRHTLDIYLLHYFFIPYGNSAVRTIVCNDSMVLQILGLSIVAAAIIALCLLVSEVLRNSNLLAHYLFGAKRTKTDSRQ